MWVFDWGDGSSVSGSSVRLRLAKVILSTALICATSSDNAYADIPGQAEAIIIRNDRGGRISRRLAEIEKIRSLGRKVEIRGQVCLSSCTMYLGLPDICILPGTSFGFHGPTRYGISLSPADFEYWSRVIAAHYPEPLKSWYMREGRRRTSGHTRISGARLIAMGVPRCTGDAPNLPRRHAAAQNAPEAAR